MIKKNHTNKKGWGFRGQGLIEYAILLALIAMVTAGGLALKGEEASDAYEDVAYLFGTPTPEPLDLYPDDRINVKVIDAMGEGIENVIVYAFHDSGSYAGKYSRTNENGLTEFFEMEDGVYKFRADLQSKQFWSDTLNWPIEHFRVIQTGQMDFPVKVVDATGKGIYNVRVYAYTETGGWAGSYGNIGSDGIVNLPMVAGNFKFQTYYQGQNHYWSEIAIIPDEKQATIYTGQEPFPVKVVDAAGNGISGARVYSYTERGGWSGKYGNTGSDGTVSLDMAEGNFKFRAIYQGHNYWSDVISLHQATSATIKTGQQSFSVRVVDAAGNGISGVRVYSYNSAGGWAGKYGNTDSDGTVTLDMSAGDFKFRAYYQGHTYWSDTISIPAVSSTTIQTNQQAFSVRVIDSSGAGLNRVLVYAYTNNGAWTGKYGYTDGNGNLNLDLANGEFKFRVYYQVQNFWSDVVSVPQTTSKTIKIDQENLTITVVNQDGKPMNKEVVYVYTSKGHYAGVYARTGADGTVTVSLSNGAYRIRSRNYWSKTVTVLGASEVKVIMK